MGYTEVWPDGSRWEPFIDPEKLRGLGGLFWRMGTQYNNVPPEGWVDTSFYGACQAAYDADLPFIGYFYDDFTWFLDNNWGYEKVKNLPALDDPRIIAIRKAWLTDAGSPRRIHAIAVDAEQETRNGKPILEPNWVGTSAITLIDNLRWCMTHGKLPEVPILVYTRASFVAAYAGGESGILMTQLANRAASLKAEKFGMWWADWRYSQGKSGMIYTAATVGQTLPKETTKPATMGDLPAWFWQYAGDNHNGQVVFDGIYNNDARKPSVCDMNTPMIARDTLRARLKFVPRETPPTPPPVDPPQPPPSGDLEKRVTALEAWARNIGFK